MGFPDAIILCTKIKHLVTYFKQSMVAADALRNFSPLKLIQSVIARWNSTYEILVRFISLSKVGCILLNIPDSPPLLTVSELQLANEIVEVLRPLEIITRELCGEKFVTATKVIPLIHSLKNKIHFLRETLRTQTPLTLVNRLDNSVSTKFGTVEHNNIMSLSALLDPRFRKLHFNQPLACAASISRISNYIRDAQQNRRISLDNNSIDDLQNNNKENIDDLWSFYDHLRKNRSARDAN